ncbi:MAG: hypothetical protein KatS3mg131_1761 [Candidatus Tectimicrobiota bacterium]|nr:MAG: hypothetical protein KatS3mg131_1761 [Candidatus Tectomicrobia bacterium]
MRFGIVLSVPWMPGSDPSQCFAEGLEEAELAEDLGFDSVWVTEHHFSLHGLCSGITPFLAALAMRTRRLRIGAAVFVLPLWNPVRLAEDVAVLDHLSGGRIEFGVGTGYRLDEFRGFNVSPDLSREMGREALETILRLWTADGPVTWEGKYYRVNDVAVHPPPRQQPHPPVWFAANSAPTIAYVAEHGFHWMAASTFGTLDQLVARRRLLDQALRQAGRDPDAIRVYTHIPTYVAAAADYEAIRQELEPGVRWFRRAARWFAVGSRHLGGTIYDTGAAGPEEDFDFRAFYEGNAFIGDAETCYRKIEAFCRRFRPTDLVFAFRLGQPHERTMRAMARFAREVLPHLRTLGPFPAAAADGEAEELGPVEGPGP